MRNGARIEDELILWWIAPSSGGGLVDGDRWIDYQSLANWAAGFASELARAGVKAGDRVAIFLDHSAEEVVALYAAWFAGAIAVPINAALKSHQIAHIMAHSGSRVLVTDRRKLSQIDGAALAAATTLEVFAIADIGSHECVLANARDLDGNEAPAAILYTSGSTGRPKGILISHANLRAGARIVASYLEIKSDERILSVLPFSFDYGLNQLLTAVHSGCTLVLQRSHFPADVLRAVGRHRITALAGVPPLWMQLMERAPMSRELEFPHLRYITNSGGTFPMQLVRRYRQRWPHVRVFLMYGLSEAFRSTYLPPEELDSRPDSIGKAIPETDVFVVDPEGKRCVPGEPGELVHRGPTVALGYWNDAEATERVFRADPEQADSPRKVVYSGDLVRRDEHGYLYFVARRDKLIKSFGYRVSPDEVEELIYASGMVAEAVVDSRPDELAGAAILAHVVPADPEAFESRKLLEFCRSRMPAYMVPKSIEVHEELPRTASGKVDRKALVG